LPAPISLHDLDNRRNALAKPVAPKVVQGREQHQSGSANLTCRSTVQIAPLRGSSAWQWGALAGKPACPPVSAARRSTRVSRSAEQARRAIGLPAPNALKYGRPPSYLDSSSLEAPTE